jgi:hypothetical protein
MAILPVLRWLIVGPINATFQVFGLNIVSSMGILPMSSTHVRA